MGTLDSEKLIFIMKWFEVIIMGCGGSKLTNASLVSNKDGKSIEKINNLLLIRKF